MRTDGWGHELGQAVLLAREALYETLWPTRCAVCDEPGEILCASCLRALPYLDQFLACPVCGAAFGLRACCECNRFILEWKGLERFGLDGAASVASLGEATHRILIAYKDRGEQRLGKELADLMAQVVPPAWASHSTLVPIPARAGAIRKRGFDQVALIAQSLSGTMRAPLAPILRARPRRDQRRLDARERLRNMQGSLFLAPDASVPKRAILVDDVFTTGATLVAAAEALRQAGTQEVFGLTFARA